MARPMKRPPEIHTESIAERSQDAIVQIHNCGTLAEQLLAQGALAIDAPALEGGFHILFLDDAAIAEARERDIPQGLRERDAFGVNFRRPLHRSCHC